MRSRMFLTLILAVAASHVFAQSKRPNILFLFTDDHAAHAISSYGSKINKTPNIDRIASKGMLFKNTFCTNSICGPSRAVILTGKHSHLNGFMRNGNRFDGAQQTFPKLLQKAGYQTAVIGKWHLGTEPTGFDFWHVYPGQGNYYNPDYRTPEGRKIYEGYSVEITTDLALDWLKDGRDEDKPFMLMCQYKAPHRNWMPGPKYLTMYDDVDIPEPSTLFDDYEGRTEAAKMQEMEIGRHMFLPYDLKLDEKAESDPDWTTNYLNRLTPEQREAWHKAYRPKNDKFKAANLTGDDLLRWKYQRYIKDYLRCVAAVDDNIGRILNYLDESGLAENTIVMYSSDQGFYLGDHGWYDKRWMYEESLRMPFVVHWPGVTKAGSVNEHLTQNLDFAQTFLEMAGVAIPDDMQGRSLVPLLKGENPSDWRKGIYYEYFEYPSVHMVNKHYGIRGDRYKLMYFHEREEWEFYDLQTDPDELTSKYSDPALQPIIEKMKQELEELRKQYRVGTAGEAALERLQKRAAEVKLEKVLDLPQPRGENVSTRLDPSAKPITVGAKVTPTAADGVIVAHGGQSYGYSLYLEKGKATFATRNQDNLVAVSGPELPLHSQSHVAGILDETGKLRIVINGEVAAVSKEAQFIEANPSEGLQIGRDLGTKIGSYETNAEFAGDIVDVRVYWGVADAGIFNEWRK